MQRRKSSAPQTVSVCWMLGSAVLSAGCTVKGFQNVPRDQPTTPSQLRSAAAVARAEADALDQIADNQEGVIRDVIGKVQQAADSLGAPALLGTAVGAAGGLFVPTPGQRRRERVAAAEGKAEAKSEKN